MLKIVLNAFPRGETHGKVNEIVSDEVRHQLRRIRIERYAQNLQSLRSEIILNAAQNLSGMLAMRSSSKHERQQHHFARILAEQKLAAVIHADRKLTRGTRHFLSERSSPGQCQQCD